MGIGGPSIRIRGAHFANHCTTPPTTQQTWWKAEN